MPGTYRESGVDVDLEFRAISGLLRSLEDVAPRHGIISSHFTGMVEFGDYALSLCTDGVGTKVILARDVGRLDTIGIDCIAMNVNDMICAGVRPLAFVDYLAMEAPSPEDAEQIGKGLARGAEMSDISIIGGETATLPEIVSGFDLAGTCLGYARKDKLITGEKVSVGDLILGIESTGPHSNGYTLIRKVLGSRYGEEFEGSTVGETLLEPTGIYVKAIMDLLDKVDVHGIAHITGGGYRNVTRLKPDLGYKFTTPIDPQPIFGLIKNAGDISTSEMYRTFNMGMGMAVVVSPEQGKKALNVLTDRHRAQVVGEVVEGEGVRIEPELLTLPKYM